jgi:hypothetical protein
MHVRMIITLLRAASDRGLPVGAEWTPAVARARAFAERAGAKFWLAVLDRALV